MITVNLTINDSNKFEIKSGNMYISKGLNYNEYLYSVIKFRTEMQYIFNSTGSVNTTHISAYILSKDKYEELIIDAFLSIQSNVEDDSFLKDLDYSYMDIEDILEYVEKYFVLI